MNAVISLFSILLLGVFYLSPLYITGDTRLFFRVIAFSILISSAFGLVYRLKFLSVNRIHRKRYILNTKLTAFIFSFRIIRRKFNRFEVFKIFPFRDFSEIALLCAAVFIYSAHFLIILNNHRNAFFLVDYDFVGLSDILANTLNGEFYKTVHYTLTDSSSYLSHHFSPGIILFAPFLYLTETRIGYAYGLLFYQVLFFILSGYLLYRKGVRGSNFTLGITIIFLNLYIYRLGLSYHFELIILVLSLLILLGIEFENNAVLLFSFAAVLLIKEDLSIYTGLLLLASGVLRKDKKLILLFFIALSYYISIKYIKVFLGLREEINWLENWSRWGSDYFEIARNIFYRFPEVSEILWKKIPVILKFLMSFGFVLLLSPLYLLFSIPVFMIHFLSDRVWYNELYNYYCYSVLPFLVFSFYYSILKINRLKEISTLLLLVALGITLYQGSSDKEYPLKLMKEDNVRSGDIVDTVLRIEPGKSVTYQFDMGVYISRKNSITPLRKRNIYTDYILVDLQKGASPYVDLFWIKNELDRLVRDKNYELYYTRNSIMLFRRL